MARFMKPKYTGNFCGRACPFLDPTEAEQDRLHAEDGLPKGHHTCTRYKATIMHIGPEGNAHPALYRDSHCMIEQVESVGNAIMKALLENGNGESGQLIEATGIGYKSTVLAAGISIEVNIR